MPVNFHILQLKSYQRAGGLGFSKRDCKALYIATHNGRDRM